MARAHTDQADAPALLERLPAMLETVEALVADAERLGDVLPGADLSPRQGRLARSDLHALDELALKFKREVARAKSRMGK